MWHRRAGGQSTSFIVSWQPDWPTRAELPGSHGPHVSSVSRRHPGRLGGWASWPARWAHRRCRFSRRVFWQPLCRSIVSPFRVRRPSTRRYFPNVSRRSSAILTSGRGNAGQVSHSGHWGCSRTSRGASKWVFKRVFCSSSSSLSWSSSSSSLQPWE